MEHSKQSIQDKLESLKSQIEAELPEKRPLIDKTIDYALDMIRKGERVEHYKEVLSKLSKYKYNYLVTKMTR